MLLVGFFLTMWVVVGLVIFYADRLGGKARHKVIYRDVDRRIAVVGERVRVTLRCIAPELSKPVQNSDRSNWDIVLVIDHSASMGTGVGSSLDEAKKAAINLIVTVPSDLRFSVVEFDHESSQIIPLTNRRKRLVRAIKRIAGGGGTDIALGLRVAGHSIARKEDAGQNRRRAIILLSDGGSASEPAIESANELKRDEDLLMFTIGTGAADMALLSTIASSSDCCFRVDQIAELSNLYAEIACMISGREVKAVQVKEYLEMQGNWGLRNWGELKPSERNLVSGNFSWLLPTLSAAPTELDYEVEALCPGWHSLSSKPAVLHAQNEGGEVIQSYSNSGPHVLVLPQVPGWQLLALLLNPLFFKMFGSKFSRSETTDSLPESRALHPEPLDLPPLQTTALQADLLFDPRPSLVVGLGFSGIHSLIHCKRLAWERSHKLDLSKFSYLAMDIADEDYFPSPSAGVVGLEGDERITLDQPLEPRIIAETKTCDPRYVWLPSAALAAGDVRPDLHRGTGHQRVLGRLALFENRERIIDRVKPLLQKLIANADRRGIDIVLTASSGGGFGSGSILDTAWLLRCLLQDLDYDDCSISLVLSAPFASHLVRELEEEKENRWKNHFALMAELDRFSTMRGEALAPDKGDTAVRRWVDRVFMVGPSSNDEWPDEEVLYPKTGDTIFNWLADCGSDSFHDFFVSKVNESTDNSSEQAHCLMHRVNPNALYLYPGTILRAMVTDTLRRTFAIRLWGIQGDGFTGYSAKLQRPVESSSLLQAWTNHRKANTDIPWVVSSIDIFDDVNRLKEAFFRGAGPGISHGVSALMRTGFFREQQTLLRAVLDTWLLDTLNGGWEQVCHSHALAACIHALHELSQRLRKLVESSKSLVNQSTSPLIKEEAVLAIELGLQACSDVEVMLSQLSAWDEILGDGVRSKGVLKQLNSHSDQLLNEIGSLQAVSGGNTAIRSPLLPLNNDQIRGSMAEMVATLGDRVLGQMGWTIQRDGQQLDVKLHLRGKQNLQWTITDNLPVEDLVQALVGIGLDLSKSIDFLKFSDFAAEDLPKMVVPPPLIDRLNPDARGIYLVQGSGHFQTSAHIEHVDLAITDEQDARVSSCEVNLSSDKLWPNRGSRENLPFVFAEEHYAYQAYSYYCREHNKTDIPLAPSLVALCREPAALISFAMNGLAENRLVSREDSLRKVWFVDTNTERHSDLSEGSDDPLAAFLRVANAWLENPDIVMQDCSVSDDASPDEISMLLGQHALVTGIATLAWYDQFIGTLWGLIRLRFTLPFGKN